MTGGKATSQGHTQGGIHPLSVHACSGITLKVQMLQEAQTAEGLLGSNTRECGSVLCLEKIHRIPGRVSQMCSLSPLRNTLPQALPSRYTALSAEGVSANNLSLLDCFPLVEKLKYFWEKKA